MKIEIYSHGIVHCSVCTDAADAELDDLTKAVNNMNLTGIESPWELSTDPTFHSGHANPCACPDHVGHRHFLMVC